MRYRACVLAAVTTHRLADPTRYGSIPISMRRVGAVHAVLACKLASSKWPVSDASTAMVAVTEGAYLADQDDVEVGSEKGPQGTGGYAPAFTSPAFA
jgi:hypothetical protein